MNWTIKKYINDVGILTSFLLLGYLINPFSLGFAFGYLMVITVGLKKEFLIRNVDFNFFLLLIFSVVYSLFYSFDPVGGIQYVFIYATAPPIFYVLGKYLVKNINTSTQVFNLLLLIAFLFSFSALISVLFVFLKGGFSELERSLPNFWTGSLISATIMGAFFTLNMCIPALLIADQGRAKLLYKVIAILIFILSLICVIRLGSRTQLGIMLITTVVSLLYIFPKQSAKKNTSLLIIIAFLILLIYKNVSFDLNADWLSTFASRMGNGAEDIASGGGRTERWAKSLSNIIAKPLGWQLNEFGFSHNLWLDVARVSGFIPFLILVIVSIRFFINVFKTTRGKTIGINLKIMFLVYSLSFLMIFMVEPIMEGLFSLFVLFCLFFGIVTKIGSYQLEIDKKQP